MMVRFGRADVRAKVADLRGPALALTAGVAVALALMAGQGRAQEKDPNKIIISHGYSTFGDLKYAADFPHLDYVNPDAPKGGEISLWAQGTFDTFNPYSAKGEPAALASVMYESLMTGTADEISANYCLICETLEYPETEDWVIFHMRRDAKFSDGSPVTAHDVVFSHHKLLDEGLPSYAEAVRALIPQAEALDDYTVKFHFAPDVPRKNLITQAGGVPIYQKAWFEKTGARLDESRLDTSPGSGAYMLDSFDVGKKIIYRRNPNYWAQDLPMGKGRNNFDTIRIEYFGDPTAALEGFKSGVYTFRQESSSLIWATGYDFPAVANGWIKREEPEDGSLPGATGHIFNLRRELLQDIRVRRALGLVYNFSWTNETLQYGLFRQRESFWQGSDLAASGLPEGLELEYLTEVKDLIDPAVLTEPAVMPHVSSGDRQLDRGNLSDASDLLDEAGWLIGDDGLRRKDGKTLDIEYLTANPAFDRILNPYIENLKQLGVNAVYMRIDPAQYGERYRTFDWDMIYSGYSNGLEEGIGLSQRFGSDGVGDVFNPAGYSSPAVDKLAEKVVAAKTREEMAAAVRAVDRIMRREYFVVPAWYLGKSWLAYYDMFEHPETLPPFATGELDWWWYNPAKAEALVAAGALR